MSAGQESKIRKLKLFITGLMLILVSFIIPFKTKSAYASELRIHDYATGDIYSYTNDEVKYKINDTEVSLETPGIITPEGSAIGPCEQLFEDCFGIFCTVSDDGNQILLQYNATRIQMTIGSLEAFVNGSRVMMAICPTYLSFNDSAQKYLYVPSRFVAETFGFTYTWNASLRTSTISRPDATYDGTKPIIEERCFTEVSVNNISYDCKDYPCYLFQNELYIPLRLLEDNYLAVTEYNKADSKITIKNASGIFRLYSESPVAYCNDDSVLLSDVPRMITPRNQVTAECYIPMSFLSEYVSLNYATEENRLQIHGSCVNCKDSSNGSFRQLFTCTAFKQVVSYYIGMNYYIPEMISAYAGPSFDVIQIRGISTSQLAIADKQDEIILRINNSKNPYGTKYFFDASADYLNYCSIYGSNDFMLRIIKSNEIKIDCFDCNEGCLICIHDGYEEFLLPGEDIWEELAAADSGTNTFSEEITITKEDRIFSRPYFKRNSFIIPLPNDVVPSMISDTDDYLNQRFQIRINGNYLAQLTEMPTYQACSELKSYSVNYKVDEKVTILTFNTYNICGYTYEIKEGYLSIIIDRPNKIYSKIVILDAGHGGIDPGTLRGSVYEKDVNFNVIFKYTPEYFKNSDIKVYYTRTTDDKIPLSDRAALASKVGADFFISFHVDSNPNQYASGTSIYYSAGNKNVSSGGLNSLSLAETLINKFTNAWGTRRFGIMTQDFVVVSENTVPAVLLECGFITNASDFDKISSAYYQKLAAKSIYDTVAEIFDRYPTNR